MLDIEEPPWRNIDASGPCWEWTGKAHRGANKKYAGAKYQGRTWGAHRLIWTLLVGEIGEGLQLDHLCKNETCVNPDHLEPVTPAENVRRGATGQYQTKPNLKKTHCPQGHPYSGDNLRLRKNGHRTCRTCDNARILANYHRRKEALNDDDTR